MRAGLAKQPPGHIVAEWDKKKSMPKPVSRIAPPHQVAPEATGCVGHERERSGLRQSMIRPGLEPGISGSGGRRLIHWANGPMLPCRNTGVAIVTHNLIITMPKFILGHCQNVGGATDTGGDDAGRAIDRTALCDIA